ncbi:hypothetical protein J3A83DRAFT_4230642 [Scleroderma citrinum]
MFRFNFDIDETIDDGKTTPDLDRQHTTITPQPFSEIPLDTLLRALPPKISHSSLTIPLPDGNALTFARRDLFDARFQLISEGTEDYEPPEQAEFGSALQFLDNPSDLVPLVYEGGLKTWECSLDLVTYLSGINYRVNPTSTRILEIGCGTAIPTLYILYNIFSSPPVSGNEIHIHLQDYNTSVLGIVTIPNIILTWYHSPAAETYRSHELNDSGESELNITPQLLEDFKESLKIYGINIRVFSGSWDTFDLGTSGGAYDVVLTSETIYCLDSLPGLVRLMCNACVAERHLCLVAAKVVYFGVGGGVPEFMRCVEEASQQARVDTVLEKKAGVNTRVMSVQWV